MRIPNLVLRFLLELGALGAAGCWGATAQGGRAIRIALATGAPVAVALVWGVFISASASRRSASARSAGWPVRAIRCRTAVSRASSFSTNSRRSASWNARSGRERAGHVSQASSAVDRDGGFAEVRSSVPAAPATTYDRLELFEVFRRCVRNWSRRPAPASSRGADARTAAAAPNAARSAETSIRAAS